MLEGYYFEKSPVENEKTRGRRKYNDNEVMKELI